MKTRSNMPLFVVETTDIKALSNSQIDLLRCGDYLVKITGNQRHAYKVTYKEDGVGMCLTYFDATYMETVSYDCIDGVWTYNSMDVTEVADNRKVVHQMDAPSSTTLTDEEIEQIKNGVFINGTILGLVNPVLMPLNESGANYRGMYIAGEKIGAFTINKESKVIALAVNTTLRIDLNSIGSINGKTLASYPANTGTFVLKMVDGVLTWVAE